MTYFARSGWTDDPKPERSLTRLNSSEVRGIAVHYTGSTTPLGDNPSLTLSKQRLAQELSHHTKGNGWSDIAYNYAVDQAGRTFELRGLAYRSAANGNEKTNRQYLAVTFLIGVGDTPTPAAIEAFRTLRRNTILGRYPAATAVVGHRDLYATECPGGPLYALVKSGALKTSSAPTTPEDDDLASKETIQEIANAVRDELFSDKEAYYKVRRPDGTLAAVPTALTEIYAKLEKLEAKLP